MNTTFGSCRCGQVAFSYDAEPKWVLNCHCEDCRRATSTPMATWVSMLRPAFRFTAGEPTYFASSPSVRRGFCGKCGSPISYEHDQMPGEIHVLAGTLSDPGALQPVAHIFIVDQLPWFDTADELPRYRTTRLEGAPVAAGPRGWTKG